MAASGPERATLIGMRARLSEAVRIACSSVTSQAARSVSVAKVIACSESIAHMMLTKGTRGRAKGIADRPVTGAELNEAATQLAARTAGSSLGAASVHVGGRGLGTIAKIAVRKRWARSSPPTDRASM